MSTRSTRVALAVRRQNHEIRCLHLWMGIRFPDVWFRSMGKNAEKQIAVILPWM